MRKYYATVEGKEWANENPRTKVDKKKLTSSERDLADTLKEIGQTIMKREGEEVVNTDNQPKEFHFSEPKQPVSAAKSKVYQEREAAYEKLKQEGERPLGAQNRPQHPKAFRVVDNKQSE